MFKLQHKTVLITYATRDFGPAIAERLGSLGAKIVLHHSDKNDHLIGSLERTIRAMGTSVEMINHDLLTEYGPESLFKILKDRIKSIDIIVMNCTYGIDDANLLKLLVERTSAAGRVIYILQERDSKKLPSIMDSIRNLATKHSFKGITINAVSPHNSLFSSRTENVHVADAAEFFASDLSDLISGQFLIINGI
jgi:3-oxoacyl-[acyl-carrier protein] reductase